MCRRLAPGWAPGRARGLAVGLTNAKVLARTPGELIEAPTSPTRARGGPIRARDRGCRGEHCVATHGTAARSATASQVVTTLFHTSS